MFQLADRRRVAALAVTLVLALPWCATAAPPGSKPGPALRVSSALLEQLRTSFWSWLRDTWTKGGCVIDPDGRPACGPTTKIGCTIDPSGNPACGPTSLGDTTPAAPNADEGCGIDPGGRPCGG